MATRAEQAKIFNEAIAQGLSEDQALQAAGITDPGEFTYGYGTNKLEPLVIGPAKRTDVEVVSNLADPYPDQEPAYRTRPVSSSTTTTTQETVTGGGATVTKVTPTIYKDTAQSQTLQRQADDVAAQQAARADQLRAEGKTGGQILRDPEYRRLSAEKQNLLDQSQNAKAVDQAGTTTTTYTPGPNTTVNQTTVDGQFLTRDTSGDDPTASSQQVNQFVASGGPVQNASATSIATTSPAVASGVPVQVAPVVITPIESVDPTRGQIENTAPVTVPVAAARPPVNDSELYRQPLGIGGNYTTVYNPETETYDVVNQDNGQVVESGLSELNAEITATQFSQGDPQFETPEMPPELPDVTEPDPPGGNFGSVFDPETQTWAVINNDTGVIVQTGLLSETDAELQAQLDSQPDPYANQLDDDEINAAFSESDLVREPTQQDRIEEYSTEGFVETEGGLYVSPEDVDPDADYQAAEADGNLVEFTAEGPQSVTAAQAQADADRANAALERARSQAILQQQRKQANDGDWRVKLRLAAGSRYLYNAPNPGILAPLSSQSGTGGVVFPYTPSITTAYRANYTGYDLTHSNYRGYFYQNSTVEDININATFTAQDTKEAEYLLAVIHFFRSVTKMFYGQDAERGAPPPLVFLQGLGEFQFNLHPCVVASFNYALPADVDYIRAGSPNINGTNLLQKRQLQNLPTNIFNSAWERLKNAGLPKGGINTPLPPPTLGTNRPTYVPTRMDMTIVLHPIQSREQVSKQFSLKQFANGDLIKGGFW